MLVSIKISPILFLLFINFNYILLYDVNEYGNNRNFNQIHFTQRSINTIKKLFHNNKYNNLDLIKNKYSYFPMHNMERRNLRRYGCRFKFCRIIEAP